MFDSTLAAIITAGTGKVNIIAVAAPARISALPDVPTLSEQGVPGFDLPSWLGFYGPAKMPSALRGEVQRRAGQGSGDSEVKDFYRRGDYEAASSTPEEFAKIKRATYDR